MHISMQMRKLSLVTVWMVSVMVGQSSCQAAVVYEDVGFIGDGYVATANNLQINTAANAVQTYIGTFIIENTARFQLILSDLAFPQSLSSLGVTLTSATQKMGQLFQPGSFEFDASPGTYYLALFGVASATGSVPGLGLYGIQVQQLAISAVPLPTPLVLLVSALMALLGIGRGRVRSWQEWRVSRDDGYILNR